MTAKTITSKLKDNAFERDLLCDELLAENEKLKQELAELKPEVEKTVKFYLGQQVMFSNNSINWACGNLAGIIYQNDKKYIEGGIGYKYCKPNPTAITHPHWIEHIEHYDGECPVDMTELVAVGYGCVANSGGLAGNINWNGVTHYCIIPKREVL